MLRVAFFILSVGMGAFAASAADKKPLARAEQLFQEARYSEAARSFEAAASEGVDREDFIHIREMQGICAGLLNRSARAALFFEEVLALDPEHALREDWPPRVTTPFFEAKAWLADHGSLSFDASPPTIDGPLVKAVNVAVPRDALHLARRVRFHIREEGGSWTLRLAEVHDHSASTTTGARRVLWWAELLGERGAVLAVAGSAVKPLEATGAEPSANPVPATAPSVAASPTPASPTQTTQPSPAQSRAVSEVSVAAPLAGAPPPTDVPTIERSGTAAPRYRLATYLTAGAGVVALGAGFILDDVSARQASTLNRVSTNAQGYVTNLTQRQAFGLDQARRTNAAVGNTLLGVGGGLALIAVLLWVVGGHSGVVSDAPSPGALQ
jgi:hypothetical protein